MKLKTNRIEALTGGKVISQQRNVVLSFIIVTLFAIAISYGYHMLVK